MLSMHTKRLLLIILEVLVFMIFLSVGTTPVRLWVSKLMVCSCRQLSPVSERYWHRAPANAGASFSQTRLKIFKMASEIFLNKLRGT